MSMPRWNARVLAPYSSPPLSEHTEDDDYTRIEDMAGRSEKGGKSYDHFCGELNEELVVGHD